MNEEQANELIKELKRLNDNIEGIYQEMGELEHIKNHLETIKRIKI